MTTVTTTSAANNLNQDEPGITFTAQKLYDSKIQFTTNFSTVIKNTCLAACLYSWTANSPVIDDCTSLSNRQWQDDAYRCPICRSVFGTWWWYHNRKHHCRLCGEIFCGNCSFLKTIKCCYRENLILRSCQKCSDHFDRRWKALHDDQSKWVIKNNKISDCILPMMADDDVVVLINNDDEEVKTKATNEAASAEAAKATAEATATKTQTTAATTNQVPSLLMNVLKEDTFKDQQELSYHHHHHLRQLNLKSSLLSLAFMSVAFLVFIGHELYIYNHANNNIDEININVTASAAAVVTYVDHNK